MRVTKRQTSKRLRALLPGVLACACLAFGAAFFEPRGSVSPDTLGVARHFRLQAVDGSWVELSSYRGKQAVLLNFFTTWCGACVDEMPALNEIQERYASEGLTVLGINLQETELQLEQFFMRTRVTYPVLLDRRGEVASRYEIMSIPAMVVIDREGFVRYAGSRIPSGLETVLLQKTN